MKSYITALLLMTSTSARADAADNAPELTAVAAYTQTRDVRAIEIVDDTVLAATHGGISVHDRRTGALRFVLTSRHGLAGNAATALASLSDGRVLVGTEYGASVLSGLDSARNPEDVGIASVSTGASARRYDPVVAIQRRGGELYIVGQHSGVRRFDSTTLTVANPRFKNSGLRDAVPRYDGWLLASITGGLERRSVNPGETRGSWELGEPILALLDDEPRALIATGERLMVLDNNRLYEVRDPDAAGPIPAVAFAAGFREAMVAARDGRVFEFVDGTLNVIATVSDRPTSIAVGPEAIWVGLADRGLARLDYDDGLQFHARPGEICSNHVTHLTRHRGVLVAGSFDGGVCFKTASGWRSLSTPSRFVLGLASDGHDLYIATSNGITRYGPEFEPRPIGRSDSATMRWLKNTAATGAAEISPGQVALSSAYGVVRIRRVGETRSRSRFFDRKDSQVPLKITLLDSAANSLFVASEIQGVTRLRSKDRKSVRYLDPIWLPEAWVTALDAVDASTLWVGTCQSGVAYVAPEGRRWIQSKDGLPDNRVTAVVGNRDEAFIGTLGGLAWSDVQGHVSQYSIMDGIADLRSSALYRDGDRLWHATEAGMVEFELRNARPSLVVAGNNE